MDGIDERNHALSHWRFVILDVAIHYDCRVVHFIAAYKHAVVGTNGNITLQDHGVYASHIPILVKYKNYSHWLLNGLWPFDYEVIILFLDNPRVNNLTLLPFMQYVYIYIHSQL